MKLPKFSLFFVFAISAFGAEPNPYLTCAERLALAGNPGVEIHIVGERHNEPTIAQHWVNETRAGKVNFLMEGANFGTASELESLLGLREKLQFSPQGPFFGIEYPLAHLLHELQKYYFEVVGLGTGRTRAQFFGENGTLLHWLRVVDISCRQARFFDAVRSHPDVARLSIWDTIESLRALGNPGAAWEAITQQNMLPASNEEYAQALRAYVNVGVGGLLRTHPQLAPWLENTRQAVNGDFQAHAENAVGDLVIVRDYFMAQSIAKIVANHFEEKKKFVVLVGMQHVADLARMLEAQFGHLPNIRITTAIDRGEFRGNDLLLSYYIQSRPIP